MASVGAATMEDRGLAAAHPTPTTVPTPITGPEPTTVSAATDPSPSQDPAITPTHHPAYLVHEVPTVNISGFRPGAGQLIQYARVLQQASKLLIENISLYISEQLASDPRLSSSTSTFVRAAHYYGRTLIKGTYNQLYEQLGPTLHAERRLFNQFEDTARVIAEMERELSRLDRVLESEGIEPNYTIGTVPSAGPYQILHEALLKRITIPALDDRGAQDLLCKYLPIVTGWARTKRFTIQYL